MPQQADKPAQGEMRRRHQAIIRSGVLRLLGSEGRLVLSIALCWADYKTCQFRMSAHGSAKVAGVQPTTIRRGIQQLVDLGVFEMGPVTVGKRQIYRFRVPDVDLEAGSKGLTRSVRPPLTRSVSGPDTQCVEPGHATCAGLTRSVSGPDTQCVPYSSIILNGSSRTLEVSGRDEPIGPSVCPEREEGAA